MSYLAESFYLEVTGLQMAQIPGDKKCFCWTAVCLRHDMLSGQALVSNCFLFLSRGQTQHQACPFLLCGRGP